MTRKASHLFPIVTLAIAVLIGLAIPSTAAADALTNANVVEMHELGFEEDVILAKIRSSARDFDTSLEALKELKAKGIPSAVLAEMMNGGGAAAAPAAARSGDPNDPLAEHSPGIYLYEETADGPRMQRMNPNVSMQTKTGGMLKSSFSFGAAKVKNRAVLKGPAAELRIDQPQPVFYFYFEEAGFGGVSPKEFALVQMGLKKGNRELVIGAYNVAGGETGVRDEDLVPFEVEEVAQGVFKVTPRNALASGEYCFYYGGASGTMAGKVFDFGIDA